MLYRFQIYLRLLISNFIFIDYYQYCYRYSFDNYGLGIFNLHKWDTFVSEWRLADLLPMDEKWLPGLDLDLINL